MAGQRRRFIFTVEYHFHYGYFELLKNGSRGNDNLPFSRIENEQKSCRIFLRARIETAGHRGQTSSLANVVIGRVEEERRLTDSTSRAISFDG